MWKRIIRHISRKNLDYDIGEIVVVNIPNIGVVTGVIKRIYNSTPLLFDIVSQNTNTIFTIEATDIIKTLKD